jgi:hypothetical protein
MSLILEAATIFAALEKAGVEFQNDGKRLGVRMSVRREVP